MGVLNSKGLDTKRCANCGEEINWYQNFMYLGHCSKGCEIATSNKLNQDET